MSAPDSSSTGLPAVTRGWHAHNLTARRMTHELTGWLTRALTQGLAKIPAMLLLIGLAMLLLTPAHAIDPSERYEDPVMQARYEKLTDELRCLVCQNQTIADSSATLAQDLRREVREMLDAGRSDQEILDFMVARYGDFVRYRPPFAPRTWLLWLAPGLLLALGLVIIVRVVTRRSGMEIEDEELFEDGAPEQDQGGDHADSHNPGGHRTP